jgi:hypothetical protein
MFREQHYNKVAALLGRRRAAEEHWENQDVSHRRAGAEAINRAVAAFVVMFEEDNPRFDSELFLKAVTKHYEVYDANLRSSS